MNFGGRCWVIVHTCRNEKGRAVTNGCQQLSMMSTCKKKAVGKGFIPSTKTCCFLKFIYFSLNFDNVFQMYASFYLLNIFGSRRINFSFHRCYIWICNCLDFLDTAVHPFLDTAVHPFLFCFDFYVWSFQTKGKMDGFLTYASLEYDAAPFGSLSFWDLCYEVFK